MPTFNDLATELVHRIIECLRDDRNSLRVLSQVSTAFHKPCRRITFSSLVFTTPRRLGNPKPNSQKLLCLLEAAPELADPEFPAYVTELTIIDGYYELVDDDSDIATRRPGWLTQDDGFPGALRMLNLTGLKRLDLRAIWSLITPEAKGLIADLCRSPSLVSLRIGEETPLRIINFCGPSLKRLTLGNVDFWSDEEELDGVQGAPAIKIDYLRLLDNVTDDGSKDMLLQFLSGVVYRIDLSGLKTLSTGSVLESGTHGIDNYLLSRMGSLETLSLGPIRVTETESHLDLKPLINLHFLKVHIVINEMSDPDSQTHTPTNTNVVVQTLKSIHPSAPLDTIRLHIHFYPTCPQCPHPERFAALDSYILESRQAIFSRLRAIEIVQQDFGKIQWRSIGPAVFPQLYQTGLVKLRGLDWREYEEFSYRRGVS